MIQEEYINFETAKLLKGKKFNGKCCGYYNGAGCRISLPNPNLPLYPTYKYSTQSIVLRWLREVHDLCVIIKPCKLEGLEHTEFYYEIYDVSLQSKLCVVCDVFNGESWATYEEACESAIQYCLENLI